MSDMRHEDKYICSDKQLRLIEERIRTVMVPDENQDGDSYRIRSLYFDTADDRFYQESLNGVERRRKYRIRFYNHNDDFVRLERKDTVGRLKKKYSTAVDKNFVKTIIEDGSFPEIDRTREDDEGLFTELYAMNRTEGLRPVTVVDYFRTAYTYPAGNIRITLDRDISCTHRTEEFFDGHALMYPVMPYGKHVLEIKYDSILPGFIISMLDIGSLERISFSKYANSRSLINENYRRNFGYEF